FCLCRPLCSQVPHKIHSSQTQLAELVSQAVYKFVRARLGANRRAGPCQTFTSTLSVPEVLWRFLLPIATGSRLALGGLRARGHQARPSYSWRWKDRNHSL